MGKYFAYVYIKLKVLLFNFVSNCKTVEGRPIINQPLLMKGLGKLKFSKTVNFGVLTSSAYYSSYGYLEARFVDSKITFNEGVWINNNCCIVSAGEGITIGKDVLIGTNFHAYDSDFHNLDIDKRKSGIPKTAPIVIEDNVFIGSNVMILKGVTIGENTVIGSGSVVVKSIPSNTIAGGNPCKVLKSL